MGPFEQIDEGMVEEGDMDNLSEAEIDSGIRVISDRKGGPPGGFNVCLVKMGKDKKKKKKKKNEWGGRLVSRKFNDQTADIPLDVIYRVETSGLYRITIAGALTVTDSGDGNLTGEMFYTQLPPAGSSSVAISIPFSGLGGPYEDSATVYLISGSIITYSALGGTYAAGGKYDIAFVVERLA